MGSVERFGQIPKRLRRDTLLYIPVFLMPAFVNILTLMLFTRFFAPDVYGDYTLVMNTNIIISSLLSQWISLSVQRFRPEYRKNEQIIQLNGYLNRLLLLMVVGVVGISVLLDVLFPNFIRPYRTYYWPSVLMVISSIVFTVYGSVYQIDLRTRQYRNLHVWQSLLKLPLIFIWLMAVSYSPVAFVWVPAMLQLVFAVPMMKYSGFFQSFSGISREWSAFLGFVRKWFRYGFPLIGWYIGTTVLNLTDRYLMEYFRTSREVGIYSANFTIAVQALALVCNPLFFAAQPLMMNEASDVRKEDIERKISAYTRLYVLVSLPFGVYFAVFRTEVSTILLGKEFVEGAIAIPVLIAGFFFWNLALYGQLCYQIDQRTKQMFYFVVVAAIVNLFSNVYLIPKAGILGAALATSVSFAIYAGLLYFSSFRHTKWNIPWTTMMKSGILAVFLGLLLERWRDAVAHSLPGLLLMGIGCVYFIFYGLFLFLLKECHIPIIVSFWKRKIR